jgi:hypothetical protein
MGGSLVLRGRRVSRLPFGRKLSEDFVRQLGGQLEPGGEKRHGEKLRSARRLDVRTLKGNGQWSQPMYLYANANLSTRAIVIARRAYAFNKVRYSASGRV